MATRGVDAAAMAALRNALIGSSAATVASSNTSYNSSTLRWQPSESADSDLRRGMTSNEF